MLLAAAAVAGLPACGLLPFPSLGASSSAPDDLVFNLEVGQCVSYTNAEGLTDLTVVDCAQPHQNEVFLLPQVPDGPFPGEQALEVQAEQLCTGQAFEDYVGVAYSESEIYYDAAPPSAETWADGDREIICFLGEYDGSEITGSLRNANR